MIAAAAEVAGEREIVVIGSQAILGAVADPPKAMLFSMEADLYRSTTRPRQRRSTGAWVTALISTAPTAITPTELDRRPPRLRQVGSGAWSGSRSRRGLGRGRGRSPSVLKHTTSYWRSALPVASAIGSLPASPSRRAWSRLKSCFVGFPVSPSRPSKGTSGRCWKASSGKRATSVAVEDLLQNQRFAR